MNIPLSRGGIMKKIQKLSFASFIFSVFALLYLVPSVSAQVDAHMNGGQSRLGAGQCDSNPACDPTSGTCCNQCDPNPACVASDPNAIPCCGGSGQNDHGGPNDHGDPCMNMPPGPAQADCYRHKDDHRGPNDHGDPNHPPGPGGPNDHHCPPGTQCSPMTGGPGNYDDQLMHVPPGTTGGPGMPPMGNHGGQPSMGNP